MRVSKPGVLARPPDTTIVFEGEELPARTGESVAAALVAAGRLAWRETRTGSERGLWCGMGVCGECALTLDGVAGRLACLEAVRPGLEAQRNPALRTLSPAPRSRPPAAAPPAEEVVECDLLVLGGGPAGLAAALAARACGLEVVVVDERRAPGGQYFKQPAFEVDEPELDAQYRAGRALVAEVRSSGARLLNGVRVWGHDGPHLLYGAGLPGSGDGRRFVLSGRALVLATGAYERGLPFPGWTLPGVMTTGAAQTLLRSYLVAAGQRVLVAGNGPLNLQVAAELAQAGAQVVAVAEAARIERPAGLGALARMAAAEPSLARRGAGYLAVLQRARVPVLSGTVIVAAEGRGRVAAATVARLDGEGRPRRGGRRSFAVDAVCVGYGFVPANELARSLGCELGLDPLSGVPVVRRDPAGRTSLDRVWVVGDGASIGGAEVARAGGTLAGLDAAAALGAPPGRSSERQRRTAQRRLARSTRFQDALWELYRSPRLLDQLATADTIVCRCEDVTEGEIAAACKPWIAAAGPLKRATRAGMGKCQGRYCSPIVVEAAARCAGTEPGPRSGFLPQAPALPVRVDQVALTVAVAQPGTTVGGAGATSGA